MKKDAFLQIVRSKAKAALSPEEEAMFGSIGEAVEQAFTADTVERKKQIEAITTQLGSFDEGESVATVIRNLATKVDAVEAASQRKLSNADKYILRSALEKIKDDIMKVVRKETNTPWGLEFKARRAASAMMTTSTVVTGAVAQNSDNVFEDVDVTVIRYPKNFIGDAINSRQVSKVPESIKWKEEIVAGDGVAAAVTEGNTKPLTDFKFEWKYAYRKKYAGRIEMTEETEIDFEQLVLDIIDMFEAQVLRKYNAGLLTDILAWAPVYAGTSLDLTLVKPTLMNVVSAGQLQLTTKEYTPDVLILNPSDYATTQNLQNVDGDPIFIPDNVLFPGLKVFITNNVTAGTCLLGDSSIIKEQHGAYILRSGTYGTQFIENEKTIVGEIFSVMKLPTESKKGWVKLVIATVKTALTKV